MHLQQNHFAVYILLCWALFTLDAQASKAYFTEPIIICHFVSMRFARLLRFTFIAEAEQCCRSRLWQLHLLCTHLYFCHHWGGKEARAVHAWMTCRNIGAAWVLCSGCDTPSHCQRPTRRLLLVDEETFKHSKLVRVGRRLFGRIQFAAEQSLIMWSISIRHDFFTEYS